jgi:hypothetical protein
MSAPKPKRRITSGSMTRKADSSYLEFIRKKTEPHSAASSTRQCEIQIEAILRRNSSVSMSQLRYLTKFYRATIEIAVERLVRAGEAFLEGSTVAATRRASV